MPDPINADKFLRDLAEIPIPAARGRRRLGRRKAVGKPQRPPRAIQLRYSKALEGLVDAIKRAVQKVIVPALPRLAPRADALDARTDGPASDIDALIEQLRAELAPVFSKVQLRRLAEIAGGRTNEWSLAETSRQLAEMGAGTAIRTAAVADQIDLFVSTNVKLIQSIESTALGRVENLLLQGVRSGSRHEDIASSLIADLGVSSSRARVIARDQVSKLNAELSRVRQAQAGITHFEWMTTRDGRERETHAENDGKIFAYDDPPVETGLPGEDVNCFTGSTKVHGFPPIKRIFRARYRGELTRVITDAGESFEATANHPILTDRGWVPAAMIKVGDKIVDGRREKRLAFDVNQDQGITFLDLFRALKAAGPSESMTATGSELYGDAAVDQQIDVVSVDWKLLCDKVPELAQATGEDFFAGPYMGAGKVSGDGAAGELAAARLASTPRSLGGFDVAFAGLRIHAGHADPHGVGSSPWLEAEGAQNTDDGPAGDSELTRDLLNALSREEPRGDGFVEVIDTVRRSANCHVFTLETSGGWYHVGGVAANCRCQALPILPETVVEDPDSSTGFAVDESAIQGD